MSTLVNTRATSALDPRLVAAARGLELTAQKLVADATTGLHQSRQPGRAREFSQYRAYQPGDEPRHIDWKLYARSDRYFVGEGEVTATVGVRLIVDATASMAQTDERPGARRKFEAARQLAAALAWIAETQGDPVGLLAVTAGRVVAVPVERRRRAFERIVRTLMALEPAGNWPAGRESFDAALATPLRTVDGGEVTRELTLILTDGHEPAGEIRATLGALRARRHEIVWLHLIGADEREFPYSGVVRFEEWETGRVVEADAGQLREAYREAQAAKVVAWRAAWGGERFDYVPIMTDAPLSRGLRAWLRRRAGG